MGEAESNTHTLVMYEWHIAFYVNDVSHIACKHLPECFKHSHSTHPYILYELFKETLCKIKANCNPYTYTRPITKSNCVQAKSLFYSTFIPIQNLKVINV